MWLQLKNSLQKLGAIYNYSLSKLENGLTCTCTLWLSILSASLLPLDCPPLNVHLSQIYSSNLQLNLLQLGTNLHGDMAVNPGACAQCTYGALGTGAGAQKAGELGLASYRMPIAIPW